MTRDEALTAEEVEGINNKNRYNINPVINKDSELLAKHILELQADKGRLIDENRELKETLAQTIENDEVSYETLRLHDEEEIAMLKAQIEKMRCCGNCDFIFWDGNCYYGKECKNKDHWKLKEIKEK